MMDILIKLLSVFPVVETVPYFIGFYLVSVLRMRKTKSSRDMSLAAWSISASVCLIYIAYGVIIVQEIPYIIAVCVAALGQLMVLGTIIYYRIKARKDTEDN